mgnify:CR=1 FL=1
MAKRKKRVEQEAEAVIIPVDFREVLPQILARVADADDLESWRAAFPQIEFMEVDEGLTGKAIDWEARSPTEKAAYVAYMADPQKVKIDYEIDVEGYGIKVEIGDSERAWYLWFSGCFDERNLSDDAKEVLLWYAAQQAGDWQEKVLEDTSPGEVCLNSFNMMVDGRTVFLM